MPEPKSSMISKPNLVEHRTIATLLFDANPRSHKTTTVNLERLTVDDFKRWREAGYSPTFFCNTAAKKPSVSCECGSMAK